MVTEDPVGGALSSHNTALHAWRRRRATVLIVALALGILGAIVLLDRAPDPCRSTVSAAGGQLWRPAGCIAPGYPNQPIPASAQVDQAATRLIRTLDGAVLNSRSYGEPVYFAEAGTPMRRITCTDHPCVGGHEAPLTGEEVVAGGSDGQLVVVDTVHRRTYEMWRVARADDGTVRVNSDGSVTVGSLSVVDLDGRGNRTADGTPVTITGAGVSRVFGVARAPEVRAAQENPATAIRHGLQLSLPTELNCSRTFRSPATKTDGRGSPPCIEQGSQVQLDPGFDCGTLEIKLGQAICFALQRYGGYVSDNGGGLGFYGQHWRSWPTGKKDYEAVGVYSDYQDLGLPISRLQVLQTDR